MVPTESDLQLTSGRLRLRRHGQGGERPVVCVPGLSANAVCFDPLAEALAGAGCDVVALDLRGRGHSEVTPAGTYGWPAHARDVLEVATRIGAGCPVDLVGHSMGAYVVMTAAALDGAQLRRLVLIDGLGQPQPAALPPILASAARLDTVFGSSEEYIARVRALGVIDPWQDTWERYFHYELTAVDGGVRARTDRAAVDEDVRWAMGHDPADLWPAIGQPTLFVRATRPLAGTGAFIVRPEDVPRFRAVVATSSTVDVDANHYVVVVHDDTVAAVRDYLTEGAARA